MKIQLLNENLVSDMSWLAEWGFSAWIDGYGHDGPYTAPDTLAATLMNFMRQ